MSARKLNILECLVRKRQVRGLRSAENKKFTFVNDWFLHENNEEIGVFWQALSNPLVSSRQPPFTNKNYLFYFYNAPYLQHNRNKMHPESLKTLT